MDISIFLAKVIGLYMIILSIGLITNAKKIKPIMIDMMDNPPLLYLAGIIALIMGLLVVVSHNVWAADWRVLITIIGWLALIKGITRVIFPDFIVESSKRWLQNKEFYYTIMLIYLLLGAYLTYIGFFLNSF